MQIYTYKNKHIYKRTNLQLDTYKYKDTRYKNTRIYTHTPRYKYRNIQTYKNTNRRIYKHTNTELNTYTTIHIQW